MFCCLCGLGSSVSIATGYGLYGPGIQSTPVKTGPGANPAPCTMDTGSFPGVKSGRGLMLIPHLLLVLWSRKTRPIPLLPVWSIRPVQSLSACTGVHFTLPLPVVCHGLKLDGQTQYLNVKLSVMWCKQNEKVSQLIKLWHLKVCCIWVHLRFQWEAAPNCGDQLQSSKLWYLKHNHELIKSQAVYLRSSLIPMSVSQEVSPVTRLLGTWSRAQIPAGARDSIPLHNVQTGSETHLSTYSVVTVVSFPCTKMVWVWN